MSRKIDGNLTKSGPVPSLPLRRNHEKQSRIRGRKHMLYVVFPPRFNMFQFRFHLRNQVISSCDSLRLGNHPASERSKAPGCPHPSMPVQVGNLVYITSDGSKTHVRSRYLVVSVHGLWCNVRKFTGSELGSTSYCVKLSECYRVSDLVETTSNLSCRYSSNSNLEDIDKEPGHVEEEPAHVPTPQSTPNPAPALVPSELGIPPDPQSDITPVPESSPLPGGSVSDIIDAPISESAFSSGPRQFGRPTRRPSYLKDYVT